MKLTALLEAVPAGKVRCKYCGVTQIPNKFCKACSNLLPSIITLTSQSQSLSPKPMSPSSPAPNKYQYSQEDLEETRRELGPEATMALSNNIEAVARILDNLHGLSRTVIRNDIFNSSVGASYDIYPYATNVYKKGRLIGTASITADGLYLYVPESIYDESRCHYTWEQIDKMGDKELRSELDWFFRDRYA